MIDEPKLQLITPAGPVPLSVEQLRALCANPRTTEFVVGGVSRRWLYDMLGRATGKWGTFQHEMSKGIRGNEANNSRGLGFWIVRRIKAASNRGVLIAELRNSVKCLNLALEALCTELRVAAETGIDDPYAEEVLDLESFGLDSGPGDLGATTFGSLLGTGIANLSPEQRAAALEAEAPDAG